MSTHAFHVAKKSSWRLWAVALLVVGGMAVWRSGAASRLLQKASPYQERAELYQKSIETIKDAQAGAWPKTEAELLQEFWKCIAARNYKQAVVYCPGSKASDFDPYSRMTASPQIQVAAAEPHPRNAQIALWPIKVKFEGMGEKTIKLAVKETPEGRLYIDGSQSIWW